MKPFFSIIVPTLNEEQYLPRLLTSIKKQRYKQYEVIIVDGKSTDKTRAIASSFREVLPELTLVTSAKQNVAFQRNLGARRARGTYFVFLDADVSVPPTYLQKLKQTITTKKAPLLTTWHKSDTDDPMDELLNSLANIMTEAARLIDKPFAGGFNTVIARTAFARVKGYNERLKIAEDHDLVLRCHKAGIELTIVRDVKVAFCMRRFRHYGYWEMIRKYATTSFHALVNDSIQDEYFDYPMGGHVYKKPSLAESKKRQKNMFRSLKNFLAEYAV